MEAGDLGTPWESTVSILMDKLGQGSYGVVYRGKEKKSGKNNCNKTNKDQTRRAR